MKPVKALRSVMSATRRAPHDKKTSQNIRISARGPALTNRVVGLRNAAIDYDEGC